MSLKKFFKCLKKASAVLTVTTVFAALAIIYLQKTEKNGLASKTLVTTSIYLTAFVVWSFLVYGFALIRENFGYPPE